MIDLKHIEAQLKGQAGGYPLDKWNPELSGDMDLVIKANGNWIHEGGKIERTRLVKLFASILRREDDGEYYLVSPVEKWRIRVEDAPIMIVDMDIINEGELDQQCVLTTNIDTLVLLDKSTILTVINDIPYITLPYGLKAKFSRSVYYRLVECAVEVDQSICIMSCGQQFELGRI